MNNRPIECVTPGDAPPQLAQNLARTLAEAFQDDPAFAYIMPDAGKRRRVMPRFFAIAAQQSFRNGEVLASPGGEAASLWYPPGKVQDTWHARLWDDLRLGAQFLGDLPLGLKMGEAVYAHHPRPQPYAYLRYVGVAPSEQGKGWGGAAIRAGIARAAERGLGVLLETATPENVPIYQRLGFEVAKEWPAPAHGNRAAPQFWTMIREAD